jgi:transcriptional regulator with XRE-family HTH domain
MDIKQKFGLRLKQLREERELSQEKLAELSGIHRTYVSSVEKGKRNLALENIEKLAIALNIDIRDFFDEK